MIMNLFSKSLCCVITEPSCQDAPVIVALKKIEYKIFFNNFFLKKCVLGFFENDYNDYNDYKYPKFCVITDAPAIVALVLNK